MEYFTIMLKEDSDKGLNILTEKLNDGYHVSNEIRVGRATTVILRKPVQEETPQGLRAMYASDVVPF